MVSIHILRYRYVCAMAIAAAFGADSAPGQNANAQWGALLQQANNLQGHYHFAEAADSGKRALAIAETLDSKDPKRAMTHLVLGNIYRDWGHCPESRANYAHAVAIWDELPDPEPKYVFTAEFRLISELLECNDLDEAEKLFKARHHDLQRFRSGPVDDAHLLALQAHILLGRRRYAEAESLFRQALLKTDQTPDARAVDTALMHGNLAAVLKKQNRYEEALAEAQRAIAQSESIDVYEPSLVDSLNTAACALFALGRRDEAAQVYERALDLARLVFGEDNRFTGMIMMNYAFVLRSIGGSPEAEAMDQKGHDAVHRAMLQSRQIIDIEELGSGRSGLK